MCTRFSFSHVLEASNGCNSQSVPKCRPALPRRPAAMVERRMDWHTDEPFALASEAREPAIVALPASSPDTSKGLTDWQEYVCQRPTLDVGARQ